eukprot:5498626-Pyramimonas_sp.AAC.1
MCKGFSDGGSPDATRATSSWCSRWLDETAALCLSSNNRQRRVAYESEKTELKLNVALSLSHREHQASRRATSSGSTASRAPSCRRTRRLVAVRTRVTNLKPAGALDRAAQPNLDLSPNLRTLTP